MKSTLVFVLFIFFLDEFVLVFFLSVPTNVNTVYLDDKIRLANVFIYIYIYIFVKI